MFEVLLNVVEFQDVHSVSRGNPGVGSLNMCDYAWYVPRRRQVMCIERNLAASRPLRYVLTTPPRTV
jgi:hypothetical protein